jgi:hypothetical protein
VDASFIYWQPTEENLELGVKGTLPSAGGSVTAQLVGTVIPMDFKYKPGFKVGLGGFFEHDNWDMHAEYTWLHTSHSHGSSVAAVASPLEVIYPGFGHPGSNFGFGSNEVFNSVDAKWKMHLDVAELTLGRWYYVGTKLTFHTTFGARGVWIRQSLDADYLNEAPFGLGTHEHVDIIARTQNWAVGPQVGLDTYWDLGAGFRAFGCGEADLTYTRFTKNGFKQTERLVGGDLLEVRVSTPAQGYVRPHVGINAGFGWGTYWDCNNWYTDLALGYEFQVFFDQNMFRYFQEAAMLGQSTTNHGNLYTQGLTATFMFNF